MKNIIPLTLSRKMQFDDISTPLVTVGMVTYNSAKYVTDAIESVLSSSYQNFELIICDDKSTDETWEIIQRFYDPRIVSLQNQQNLREYPNRNKVLDMATGKYLIYIDGDDLIYPHGLEYMVSMFEKFPESAMALARPESDHIIYPYEMSPSQIFKYDFMGDGVNYEGLTATMFRTDVLKAMGGFSTDYIAGDTFIKKKISLSHKSVLIANGLTWWRRTPGQASSRLNTHNVGMIESLNYNLFLLDDPQCPLTEAEKKLSKKFLLSRYTRTMVKSLGRLDLKTFIMMFKSPNIKLSDLRFIFLKYIPDYQEGSSSEPLRSRIVP